MKADLWRVLDRFDEASRLLLEESPEALEQGMKARQEALEQLQTVEWQILPVDVLQKAFTRLEQIRLHGEQTRQKLASMRTAAIRQLSEAQRLEAVLRHYA
jgi:hypothetical protein